MTAILAKVLSRGAIVVPWMILYGCGPSFVEVQKERTPLIGGMQSYGRIAEVQAFLGPKAADWEVIEDSGRGGKDRRPPFEILTVLLHDYRSEEFSGKLMLTFFNNRLMTTSFYPDDHEAYRKALETKLPTISAGDLRVPPFTLIQVGFDRYRQEAYVSWKDVRLEKEYSLWIDRYS